MGGKINWWSKNPCLPSCPFQPVKDVDNSPGHEMLCEDVNPADAAKIIYTKLHKDQTRIVCLHSGTFGEPLIASLKIVDIAAPSIPENEGSTRVQYDALSYCWGLDQRPRWLLRCNDEDLPITIEAYRALQYLRSPSQSVHIWIDAICINQYDDLERSLQIPLMINIYRMADCVHVWLEEHSGYTRLACLFLQVLADMTSTGDPTSIIESTPFEAITRLNKSTFITPVPCYHRRKLLSGLHDLVSRPWFGRVWVIQEVWAARNILVHCGDVSFSWGAFARCNHMLKLNHKKFPPSDMRMLTTNVTKMEEIDKRLINSGQNLQLVPTSDKQNPRYLTSDYHAWDIVNVLRRSQGCNYSFAHDRIYGILGMTTVGLQSENGNMDTYYPLVISYQQPVAVLFRKLAMYLIKRDQCLTLLNFRDLIYRPAPTDEHEDLRLPSWTPDWRRLLGNLVMEKITGVFPICLSPTFPDSFEEVPYGGLRLRGIRVGSLIGGEKGERTAETGWSIDLLFKPVILTSALYHILGQDKSTPSSVSEKWSRVLSSSLLPWQVPETACYGDILVAVEGAWAPLLLRLSEFGLESDVPQYRYIGPATPDGGYSDHIVGPMATKETITFTDPQSIFTGKDVIETLWEILEVRESVGKFEYFTLF